MPVIIKRYRNRKLYNTQSKSYVTLEEVEELVKHQEEIIVIDNDSENDITSTTLSQIIFGIEKNHTGLLPIDLLISMIQTGGIRMDEIRRNIFDSMNLAHHYFDSEIERRMNHLILSGELKEEAGNQLLEKLLSVGYMNEDIREDVEFKFIEFLRERQLPTKRDFQSLIDKVESLSNKVDDIKLQELAGNNTEKVIQIIE